MDTDEKLAGKASVPASRWPLVPSFRVVRVFVVNAGFWFLKTEHLKQPSFQLGIV